MYSAVALSTVKNFLILWSDLISRENYSAVLFFQKFCPKFCFSDNLFCSPLFIRQRVQAHAIRSGRATTFTLFHIKFPILRWLNPVFYLIPLRWPIVNRSITTIHGSNRPWHAISFMLYLIRTESVKRCFPNATRCF